VGPKTEDPHTGRKTLVQKPLLIFNFSTLKRNLFLNSFIAYAV